MLRYSTSPVPILTSTLQSWLIEMPCSLHRATSLCSLLASLALNVAMSLLLIAFSSGQASASMCPLQSSIDEDVEREIRVPIEDLPAILSGASQRIFMTREQYESMLKDAKIPAESTIPNFAGILSARYSIQVHNGRADIVGELEIESLRSGLQAIAVNVSRVGLLEATLDGKPAKLCQGLPGGSPLPHILLDGIGLHRLQLKMVGIVTTDVAQQSLQVALPRSPSSNWSLEVEGNVEIRSGVSVRNRVYNENSNRTQFDLLPPPVVDGAETATIGMSLNNRWLHDSRSVRCYSVILDELSETSETLQASMHVDVLNGALDRFEFSIPSGFEVAQLSCPQMMRWTVEKSEQSGDLTCVIEMRESIRDQSQIDMQLTRVKPASFDTKSSQWNWPILTPTQVQSHTAILGLSLESTLQCETIQEGNLIAVDHAALNSLFLTQARGSGVQSRIVTAFYAPSANQSWNAAITREVQRTKTQSYLVEAISNSGLEIRGSYHIEAMHESVAYLDVEMPKAWQITEASIDDGAKLRVEPLSSQTDTTTQPGVSNVRTRIHFDRPIERGGRRTIYFVATSIPEGWLGDWQTNEVIVPRIQPLGVENTKTFVATQVADEIQLEITDSNGLSPLFESEKQQIGIKAAEGALAFQTDQADWNLKLNARQKESRVTSQSYSFLKFGSDEIVANYELHYQIQQGSVRELQFSLPESTPAELDIRGLGGTTIKESTSTLSNGRRIWRVLLMQRTSGTQKISAKFQQPLKADATLFTGPVIRTVNVSYQTGAVAIEGDDELDVIVRNHPQSVDVGEFIDAEFAIGDRLIGTYGYSLSDPAIVLDEKAPDFVGLQISRRVLRSLPTTLAETLEMNTVIGAHGVSQHSAYFHLRTTGEYIEIVLPKEASLWSVMIDSVPVLPQRQNDKLVVELPTPRSVSNPAVTSSNCTLAIVYELPSNVLGTRTRQSFAAPLLLRRADNLDESADALKIPIVDSRWKLWLPPELELTEYQSNLTRNEIQKPLFMSLPAAVSSAKSAAPSTADFDSNQNKMEIAQEPANREQASFFSLPPNPAKPSAPIAPTPNRLDGVRSLDVRLAVQSSKPSVTLSGYGSAPFVDVTLIHSDRIQWFTAVIAGIVASLGLIYTRGLNHKAVSYFLILISVASIVPWITWWNIESTALTTGIWYGLGLIVIGWTLIWVVLFTNRCTTPRPLSTNSSELPASSSSANTTLPMNALMVAFFASYGLWGQTVVAQGEPTPQIPVAVPQTSPPHSTISSLDELLKHIKEGTAHTAVAIPENAIVVPYSTDANQPNRPEDKILVPYATYQRLWNASNPNKPMEKTPAPAEYSFSNLEYRTTLNDGVNLRIEGQVVIHQNTEQNILLSFGFDGGVLLEAMMNERPAQVKIADKVLMITSQGIGEKTFRFAMQFPVQRRGGWRVVDAKLPTAVANKLVFGQTNTDVELRVLPRQETFEISNGEKKGPMEFDLPTDGGISIQWRPKTVTETVDQGLNLESIMAARVSEEGVSIQWQVMLDFRRSQRDQFEFSVPLSLKVDQVLGTNIRGWSVTRTNEQQLIQVTLLKTAHQSEALTIVAHQSERLGSRKDSDEVIALPVLKCLEAMRHVGQINLFHSALLDVSVKQSSGLNRIDLPDGLTFPTQRNQLPVETRPFRSYRFSSAEYQLELQAKETSSKFVVEHQSILRVSRSETRLETRLLLNIKDRAIHDLDIQLPSNWKPSVRSPNIAIQSSVTQTQDGKSNIAIRFPSGQLGIISIILEASQVNEARETDQSASRLLDLPRIDVVGSESQRGDIAVQVDSGFTITSEQLVECEPCAMSCVTEWLLPEQQPLTKLVIRCSAANYAGKLRITPREPRVRALAISNIKLTQRSLEETIYLSWNIEDAGIDVVEFSLPKRMSDAKVLAQMARRIRRMPVDTTGEGSVRFQIELQDKVIGQYRVLVQRDTQLPREPQTAPIPTGITGEVQTRLITLENSGRDELLVDSTRALSPLVRGDAQWTELGTLLGGNSAIAYRVDDRQNRASSLPVSSQNTDAGRPSSNAENPELVFSTTERSAVETANARIGLAMTTLVVDQGGAYRAVQEYRIENAKEAYLELELPAGADLWTASVSNRPVKPIRPDSNANAITSDRLVRLPLVRTQLGDLDYGVVLKYAGKLPSTQIVSKFDFPLIKTVNINVELSQVRLHLPENQYWYGFGGSLGRVEEEAEFLAGWLSFKNKQIDTLSQVINNSKDSFSKARAAANRRALQSNVNEALGQQSNIYNSQNRFLMQQLAINSATRDALQNTNDIPVTEQQIAEDDNRNRFNNLFDTQSNGRANDQLRDSSGNFTKHEVEDNLQSNGKSVGNLPSIIDDAKQSQEIAGALLNGSDKELFRNSLGLKKDNAQQQADRTEASSFKQQARRYQMRLEQRGTNDLIPGEQSTQQPPGGYGGFGQPNGGGTGGRQATASSGQGQLPSPTINLAVPSGPGEATPQSAGYLASLDIDIPMRGRTYLFATPRGQVALSANGISYEFARRLFGLLCTLLLLAIAWSIRSRLARRQAATTSV